MTSMAGRSRWRPFPLARSRRRGSSESMQFNPNGSNATLAATTLECFKSTERETGSTRVSRVGFGVPPNPAAGRADERQNPIFTDESPQPPASGATPEATRRRRVLPRNAGDAAPTPDRESGRARFPPRPEFRRYLGWGGTQPSRVYIRVSPCVETALCY